MVGFGPTAAAAAIGPWATGQEAFALLTVDVPAEHWLEALGAARDGLGLGYFDWLSAVDELADGFSVAVHLAAVPVGRRQPGSELRHLLLRTRIARDTAVLPTATALYAGADWHERETHEMFGIDFADHPQLTPLLLPDGFEGHPLRKEFVLAARVAKAWPGAKEPGESDHSAEGEGAPATARRRMLPPGVPDPNEWGPLAGTLPPAPARPARGAARSPRAAAGGAGTGTRTDTATRTDAATDTATGAPTGTEPRSGERPVRTDRPRRTRSVDQGSTSQAPPASESDAPTVVEPGGNPEQPGGSATAGTASGATRAPDAPWQSAEPPTGTSAPDTPARDTPARDTPARDSPAPDSPAPDGAAPVDPASDGSAPESPASDASEQGEAREAEATPQDPRQDPSREPRQDRPRTTGDDA